ncbi:hypothetical protein ASD76_16765 [Altererythrobacter sp. Root672]|nr:hypothetical protein ASD76_16765 [Altererythrobacter sp. Root672]
MIVARRFGSGFIEGSAPYGLISMLQLVAFAVTAALFLRWTYIATANAHAFRAEGLRFGPWLAVGSYFIPIANLIMPLQSMRDTWKATVEPRDWEIVRVPAVLGLWWAFWLASNIAGIAAFRLADTERYPEMGELTETLTILSDCLTLGSSLLLSAIVRKLSGLQQGRVNSDPGTVIPTRPAG